MVVMVLSGDALVKAQNDGRVDEPRTEGKVLVSYVTPENGLIDNAFVDSWEKDFESWLHREPAVRFVVFRINSRGGVDGDIRPVERITSAIERLRPRGIRTIAHIDNGHQAANGATAIVLACNSVIMGQSSRLGYLADSETEVPDARKDDARTARGLLGQYAGLRPRLPSALGEAFVSKYHQTVLKVTFEKHVGANVEEIVEIVSADTLEAREANLKERLRMRLRERREIVSNGKRLALSAQEALEYKVADRLMVNSFDDGGRAELLASLNILVDKSNIVDQVQGVIEPPSESGQAFINILNHPVTRFILLMAAFVGLVLELKMPGTFVPIACSGICFLLFFIGGCFPAAAVTGVPQPTTTPFEIALFLVGAAMMTVELFLLPGVIVFALLGLLLMLVSIVLAMTPSGDMATAATMTIEGAITILVLAVGTGLGIFFLLIRFLPQSSMFNRSGLITTAAIQGVPTADSIVEAQQQNATLVDRIGIAMTALRPAGKVEIDGKLLDVVAEGDFVDKGDQVKIIEVSVLRAVVRKHSPASS